MASDSKINMVVTLTPHPDKMDRCIEIMMQATQVVHRTEPGTLRYHLHVEMKDHQRGESIVFLEEYENQAAWDKHCQGEAYNYMGKTMGDEEILAHPPSMMLEPWNQINLLIPTRPTAI
ncbi:MAG: hypothetical protein Q9207_006137 [Kuettlingeria erythrocarpa]